MPAELTAPTPAPSDLLAESTYRTVTEWIIEQWAPALASCNRDKGSIRAIEQKAEQASQ